MQEINFEIFKKEDPSGKMSRKSYVINNFPDHYKVLKKYIEENELSDVPFKEIIFLFLNSLSSIPKCKNLNCNNLVKFKNSTIGYLKYCSNKCISSDPQMKELKEKKSFEKFGTKAPAQSEIIKNKIIKTNQEKWGFNSPMCSKQVQQKSKQTLKKNWGVENPTESEDLLSKRIDSFKRNIDSYKESYKKTSLERYGVDHPWKNKEIHDKTIEKFYKNYKERIQDKIKDTKFQFIEFNKNEITNLIFKCPDCELNFSINTYQFYFRSNNKLNICTECFPISENSSISQIELYNFIKNNYNGEISQNIKSIISPYELDIFLPEINLAFEFNGVYWYSEKFKSREYHLNKFRLCEEKNIKLINIWEDDWSIKRNICESFILNQLGLSKKIWARKCIIKEIDSKTSKKFLEDNHFQGDCKSSVRVGLFFEDEIVSLMTFSKLRLPLGGKNKEGYWELTRFCNLNFNVVVGSASKLLKYFKENYNPIEIQTYSDNLISTGHLYKLLGFSYKHTSKPGYWWVINGIRQHRFNWRKDKLKKLGSDMSKSENQIMEEMGYFKLYNAGNKKWTLNIK
jgi:hypothetical protein